MLDLTTNGVMGNIGEVFFQQTNTQPTGVGVINDFLRIQAKKSGMEQGYNSDVRPVQFDEKTDHHTRSVRVTELPIVTRGNVTYRAVLLGINQNQANPLLSLDELRFYAGDDANVSGYDATTKKLGTLSPVYDMGDNWVKMDASLTHGNGSGDAFVFIPDALLVSPTGTPDPYVYVYSKFGERHASNGGFEQWAPGVGAELPGPTGSLSGFVYHDVNQNGFFDADDTGIAGVLLTLTGTDDLGSPFTRTTTTNEDGSYAFVGLVTAFYEIAETQPVGFEQGTNNVGTIDGLENGQDLGSDILGNIQLLDGQAGINYNFGERTPGE
jgi:hypothetical protein